jgi:hypothetical protein
MPEGSCLLLLDWSTETILEPRCRRATADPLVGALGWRDLSGLYSLGVRVSLQASSRFRREKPWAGGSPDGQDQSKFCAMLRLERSLIGSSRVREKLNFTFRFKLIWVVQSFTRKYSCFAFLEVMFGCHYPGPPRGASRERHETLGREGGGRESVVRERGCRAAWP